MTPSITHQPIFKPKMNRQMSMEQLRRAQLAFVQTLESQGITFASNEDDDGFWKSFDLFTEETFNWPDYASHN